MSAQLQCGPWPVIVGFILGCLAGFFTEFVRHRFSTAAAKQSEARARLRDADSQAYAPAVYTLDAMIDAYPQHANDRSNLRRIIQEHGYLFDPQPAAHLWVALSESAALNDLITVRQLLTEAREEKRSRLTHL